MSSIFVGKVLMSMYEQPTKRPADDELAPIKPGVRAAWAQSYADARASTASVSAAPVMNPTSDPRSPKLVPGPRHG